LITPVAALDDDHVPNGCDRRAARSRIIFALSAPGEHWHAAIGAVRRLAQVDRPELDLRCPPFLEPRVATNGCRLHLVRAHRRATR